MKKVNKPTITAFNRETCKALATKAEDALKEVFKNSGIEVERKSGSFSEFEYTLKVNFTFTDGETQAHRDYKQYAEMLDMPLAMLDATFNYGELGVVTITGFLPSRPKFNITVTLANGKNKIAPFESVKRWYEKTL